jgi:hypothetical protein
LLTPYAAWECVKPSYSSCSMRPWRENDEIRRYDLAFLTACAFQLTRRWATAQRASELEKCSYSSCSTRPDLENADTRRYDWAFCRALRWPAVEAWAQLASGSAARTTMATARNFFMVLLRFEFVGSPA